MGEGYPKFSKLDDNMMSARELASLTKLRPSGLTFGGGEGG